MVTHSYAHRELGFVGLGFFSCSAFGSCLAAQSYVHQSRSKLISLCYKSLVFRCLDVFLGHPDRKAESTVQLWWYLLLLLLLLYLLSVPVPLILLLQQLQSPVQRQPQHHALRHSNLNNTVGVYEFSHQISEGRRETEGFKRSSSHVPAPICCFPEDYWKWSFLPPESSCDMRLGEGQWEG